jgi:two-component system sensor histidine kinase/response regulator
MRPEPTAADPAGTRRLTPTLPGLCAGASVALGVTVLAGWALDVTALKSLGPGLIAMKPNAALGFILAGSALGAIRDDRRRNRLASGLASSVVTLGAFTLFEYASGLDLGIDQVLAREPPGAMGSLHPGRMHPTTAFDFLAVGVAMVLIAADRGYRTAHALAILAALVAGSALIGYAYGVRLFVGLAVYNQMALHTTVGMLALSAGVLTARPGRGLMAAITSDTAGGLMARRLLPWAILLPITLDGLALLSRRARMFDERFATAIRVIATIAIFVGVIGRLAHWLARLDRERRRSDDALRFLADAMPQIAWTARPDGTLDYCNGQGTDHAGRTFEQAGGRGWTLAIHPDDLARRAEVWSQAVRSGRGCEIEYRIRRASDGSYRWHLGRAEPMRDEQGRVIRWFGTSTDIHDQKLAGEQRFRSLVEATTAIVWNTPASGEFESEQPGWGNFTGQSFDQLRGWGWLDAVHPEDRPETTRVWTEAVASQSLYQVEHRLRRHDGQYRHMLVRAVPILSQGRTICEWVGVHTDVDTQKRAEVALREAKEAAEAATRAKGEFLANMSHEIRTPMNGILGMTELTLGTELTPRQREYLGLVKSSARALLRVIDDILDFSKIEAGKLHLDPVSFSLRDEITDTLRILALRAHEKGLELACRIAPEVPETLIGDPGRLRQILVNLVGNAIKFTEHGEVCVSIETGGTGPALSFAVADTGIGIPAAKRTAIFAPFEQADGSTTRKYGGTGLGLTISSRLVAIMGGRIWVEDNPGGGSVFRFTVQLAADPEARPTPSPADPGRLAGLRALIVDDNRTNRLILEELLAQWGCRTASASGGPEALAAVAEATHRREPFEVILLDRMMPEMDGCTLAQRIDRDPDLTGVPMLMLTSGGSDESVRFRELGIGAWLAKPVRQSELLAALLGLLRPAESGCPSIRPANPGPAPAPVPCRSLRVLLADDHPINQMVASRILEQQGHRVAIVGDGRAAVEAAGPGDFDVILMDVQMPEMDGFEALAAIRSAERGTGRHVPIVALTAHAMAGDRERCLTSGFDAYLSKPVHAAALRAPLDRLAEAGIVRPAAPAPPDHRLAFDRAAALDILGGDETLLAEVLGLFLDDAPRLLREVRGAVEASDAATLNRLAHTIAGVSGNFAAPALVASARRLEAMSKAGDLTGAADAEAAMERDFEALRAAVAASGLVAEGGCVRAS